MLAARWLFEEGRLAPGYDLFRCVVNIPEDAQRVGEPLEGELAVMTSGAMGQLYGAATMMGPDERNGRFNPALEVDDDADATELEQLRKPVRGGGGRASVPGVAPSTGF